MQKENIERYWEEKEAEKGSKLIVATVADYFDVDNKTKTPISGLLYFMKNGLYFENFSNQNWFGSILGVKEEFKKFEFSILKSDIVEVCDSTGKKNKEELSVKDKILRFFNVTPRFLLVNYLENNQKKIAKFKSVEEPLNICEKYYNI